MSTITIVDAQGQRTLQVQVHEVTHRQFAEFVQATGYITDAEKSVLTQAKGAGTALFTHNHGQWTLNQTVNWRMPFTDYHSTQQLADLPVVHVSHRDAEAYAKWAQARLPTEEEWTQIALSGLKGKKSAYAGAYTEDGSPVANTWQGIFPIVDTAEDGYQGVSPVGCFQADINGMVDLIGNVWEWTATQSGENSHRIKGGSYLCAKNYCRSYQPYARQQQESDFSSSHIGFRIVRDPPINQQESVL